MPIGVFFLIFAIILIIATPVAVLFGGMSFLPSLLDPSFPYTIQSAIRSMVNGLDSFVLLAIPLFMLAGVIMTKGGISNKLFNFIAYFIGNKTAGFPCAVIGTCMLYAAISGSSPATVSAVGAMAIPFLVSMGYDKVFATAIVTVAGGLGVIIPPSISYIVYASIANTSPSQLFIGGIIPGILIGLSLMIYAYVHCRIHGEDKEKLLENYKKIHAMGFWKLFKDSFWGLLSPVIILGSIYGGIASPTEAAAISVAYALILSLFVYKTLKIKDLYNVFLEGSKTYVAILFIIAAAIAFGRVITMLQYPQVIGSGLLSLFSSKVATLVIINLILLACGMVIDNIPNILILTPIFLPIVTTVGMDPVHFGIMLTANLAIGMVTPPMGINTFVASSMTGLPILTIARATVPFLVAFLIALIFITFIPELSLYLSAF
jgi:C4-dicarboxylate transporter, DctM subunit